MLNIEVSKEDHEYIRQIAVRAFAARLYRTDRGDSMLDVLMDLKAVHCNGCPLDLAGLVQADDMNFAHDLLGIRRYLDRHSGTLTEFFTPRYARSLSASATR